MLRYVSGSYTGHKRNTIYFHTLHATKPHIYMYIYIYKIYTTMKEYSMKQNIPIFIFLRWQSVDQGTCNQGNGFHRPWALWIFWCGNGSLFWLFLTVRVFWFWRKEGKFQLWDVVWRFCLHIFFHKVFFSRQMLLLLRIMWRVRPLGSKIHQVVLVQTKN